MKHRKEKYSTGDKSRSNEIFTGIKSISIMCCMLICIISSKDGVMHTVQLVYTMESRSVRIMGIWGGVQEVIG